MKSGIKLIATDMDGTLLQNYAPACSPEAIRLMNQLSAQGVYIVPASGRQYYNLHNMFYQMEREPVYLCENGALVLYQEQVLLKRIFERELAMKLCHMVIDQPECEVLISGERTGYLIPKSQDYVTYMVEHIKNDVTVITAPEEIQEPVIKVSYFIPEQYRQSVTEKFQEIVGDTCLVAVSGNEWVDFAPLGTSKGSALAAIGEGLGIDPAEMAAFGDNENDRSMLELVGHPYLMKNCNPTMEDLSAIRCSSVEEELKKLLAE